MRAVQERDHRRHGGAVLDHEHVAALEELEFRAGDAAGHALLGSRQGDAVIAARGDQDGTGDQVQPLPGVVPGAGFELAARAHGVAGLVGEGIARAHGDELSELLGMGRLPGGVAAGIGDRDQEAGTRLALKVLDLVEGIGGAALAAG